MFDVDQLQKHSFINSLQFFAELPSTNDHAKELANSNLALPCLILTECQTAGRGRGNNRWLSDGKQLTFSLIVDPGTYQLTTEQIPTLSIVTALALCQAIESTVGTEALIKWPNDVYLNGKKLAGILLEAPRPNYLVIGVGLNLSWAPTDPNIPGIALSEASDISCDANNLLVTFLDKLEKLLRELNSIPKEVAAQWNERSYLTGKRVLVESDNNKIHGLCGGLGNHGELLIKTEDEFLTITSGTIVKVELPKT